MNDAKLDCLKEKEAEMLESLKKHEIDQQKELNQEGSPLLSTK